MSGWREIAQTLGLAYSPPDPGGAGAECMEGDLEGFCIWLRRIEEFKRTARTGISLSFEAQRRIGLKITASANARTSSSLIWLIGAFVFFALGIGGAVAASHPGPLAVCIGGVFVLLGWRSSRKAAGRALAGAIRTGDEELDRALLVKAENEAAARALLMEPGVRKILLGLAEGDRELKVTDVGISLELNKVLKTAESFEEVLGPMAELASVISGRAR